MSGLKLNLLAAALVGLLLLLQYRLWFSSDGVRDFLKLRQNLASQKDENSNLKKGNEELLFQIQRLQNSHEEAEVKARNELGMIKKDETFYQVVK